MDNFMLISWIDRQLDRLSSEELEGQEHVRQCMTSQRRHVTSLKHTVNNTLSCPAVTALAACSTVFLLVFVKKLLSPHK